MSRPKSVKNLETTSCMIEQLQLCAIHRKHELRDKDEEIELLRAEVRSLRKRVERVAEKFGLPEVRSADGKFDQEC